MLNIYILQQSDIFKCVLLPICSRYSLLAMGWGWIWAMNQRHPLYHVTKQLPPLLSFTEPGLGTQPVSSTWWVYGSWFMPAKVSRGKGSWVWAPAIYHRRAGRKTWSKRGSTQVGKVRPGVLVQIPLSSVEKYSVQRRPIYSINAESFFTIQNGYSWSIMKYIIILSRT